MYLENLMQTWQIVVQSENNAITEDETNKDADYVNSGSKVPPASISDLVFNTSLGT